MRRCRSRDCFLNPPFSKPVQILEIRVRRVNRKIPIPINFFNVQPSSSNHHGTVCYTRKTHFPGGGNRSPGQESAPRALARRGFPRTLAPRVERGGWRDFHPEGRPHLHKVFSNLVSPRQIVFRCSRGRSPFPPGPASLLITLIGSAGENFIVSKNFPCSPGTGHGGIFAAEPAHH